jgi:D-glycero-beta-D-manno-heptose-7-phosphate kinase
MLTLSSAISIIQKFPQADILVVGDIMLDEYEIGAVDRISPEAPVPVIRITGNRCVPGGAANVAGNLKSLGCNVWLAGVTGNDKYAATTHALLTGNGINTSLVHQVNDRPTIVKKRVMAHNHQLLRMDYEEVKPLREEDAALLISEVEKVLDRFKVVILSDYAKGTLSEKVCKTLIGLCRAKNIQVVVDPKPKNIRHYQEANIITPNRSEAFAIFNIEDKATAEQSIQAQLDSFGFDAVLLTKSEDGISIIEKQAITSKGTHAKEVYDVTGAGDTVISVFSAGLAVGAGITEAAFLANIAAGIVVARIGTSVVEPQELIEECREEIDN